MRPRPIKTGVTWMGAVDWDNRLFDSLVPLPDGTSYNAYLVDSGERKVLIDTVEPSLADQLMAQLADVPRLDFLVSLHAEQDHSGAIPRVLDKYPEAVLVASSKAEPMLIDHLQVPGERIRVVADGEALDLGGRTLRFLYTPWVHWPETMSAYLEEDRVLFTCDFFGSHLATSDLFARDEGRVHEAAKRYFAEIMMPFRKAIAKNLAKLTPLEPDVIAPSHGPVHDRPEWILEAYREWVDPEPKNRVVLAYVSMHHSTKRMVDHLVGALIDRGVAVDQFNLVVTDLGKLAMALVDAATILIGTPVVLNGPHPAAAYAAFVTNMLKPKARFVGLFGSFGWKGKKADSLTGMMSNLKAEFLEPVWCKGHPTEADLQDLEGLADAIATRHGELALS